MINANLKFVYQQKTNIRKPYLEIHCVVLLFNKFIQPIFTLLNLIFR